LAMEGEAMRRRAKDRALLNAIGGATAGALTSSMRNGPQVVASVCWLVRSRDN